MTCGVSRSQAHAGVASLIYAFWLGGGVEGGGGGQHLASTTAAGSGSNRRKDREGKRLSRTFFGGTMAIADLGAMEIWGFSLSPLMDLRRACRTRIVVSSRACGR